MFKGSKNTRARVEFYWPIILLFFYFVVLTTTGFVRHFEFQSTLALLLELFLSAIFLAWCVRRFTRTSDRHVQSFGSITEVWGGYLAIFWLFTLLVANWWGSLLFYLKPPEAELFTDRMDRLHASAYTLEVVEDGHVLLLDGDLSLGLTKIVRATLKDNPQISEFWMRSKGGNIFEARGLAKLIVERKMRTYVTDECSSACTIVFIAGANRDIAPEAKIGFHQYALQYRSALYGLDLEAEQRKDQSFFLAQGVSAGFIERIFDKPHSQIWYPDRAELASAGVLSPRPL